MLSILVESDNGTMEYVEVDPHECIAKINVASWCCEEVSKHVCCPSVCNEEPCSICLDTMVHNCNVLKIQCGHAIHLECAQKWFSTCIMSGKPAKCPLCNLVVICPVFHIGPGANFPDNAVYHRNSFSRFMNYIRRIARCL